MRVVGALCEPFAAADAVPNLRFVGTDGGLLVCGRCVYVKRGASLSTGTPSPTQPMVWYGPNGFWHGGERRFLGQLTGWLIVADQAVSPDRIVSTWKVWEGGRLWLAPRVRCVADDEALGHGGVESEGEEDEEGEEDPQAALELDAARLQLEIADGGLWQQEDKEFGFFFWYCVAALIFVAGYLICSCSDRCMTQMFLIGWRLW